VSLGRRPRAAGAEDDGAAGRRRAVAAAAGRPLGPTGSEAKRYHVPCHSTIAGSTSGRSIITPTSSHCSGSCAALYRRDTPVDVASGSM
jgi:hypothetical protein